MSDETRPVRSARFEIGEIAASLPERAKTLLVDHYLTDRDAASARVFRVYQGTPAHYHATCDEYLYVFSGRGTFWMEDPATQAEFAPGQLLFFEKGVVHALPDLIEEPVVFLAVGHAAPPSRRHHLRQSGGWHAGGFHLGPRRLSFCAPPPSAIPAHCKPPATPGGSGRRRRGAQPEQNAASALRRTAQVAVGRAVARVLQRPGGQAEIVVQVQQGGADLPEHRIAPLLHCEVAQAPDHGDLLGRGSDRIAECYQQAVLAVGRGVRTRSPRVRSRRARPRAAARRACSAGTHAAGSMSAR